MAIGTVGVIGAGQMGGGIIQVIAEAGYNVLFTDKSEQTRASAKGAIEANMNRAVAKSKMTEEDRDAALFRMTAVSDLRGLSECDLVIEAAVENEDIKRAIFQELCGTLKQGAIVCTNTSSISVTRLASATDRPELFMGLHFMNPVPVMKLVEMIRGIATSAETFETVHTFTKSLGKITTTAEDFPGFIVNRILLPMINEAIYTLYEGVGNVESIDTSMKLGTSHPMGPLELADFIGLDTCLAIMQVLYEGLADSKYRPCPLLVKYVEAGWVGRKSGKGFYDYSGDAPVPTR